jgi:small subunit ribosomal protein S8
VFIKTQNNMDPLADLFTILRNGYSSHKLEVSAPYSKIKEALLKILKDNNYIKDFSIEKIDKVKKMFSVKLNYVDDIPAITKIKRVSRPSVRIYAGAKKIPGSLSGTGITIVSTSSGILTDKQARKKRLRWGNYLSSLLNHESYWCQTYPLTRKSNLGC